MSASTPKDAAVAANLLRKFTAEQIENAKCQLSCQNEKCVRMRTFIDCDKYFKQYCRANEELKRLQCIAKFEEIKAANAKMAEKIKVLESNANSSVPNEMAKNELLQQKPVSSQDGLHQLPANPSGTTANEMLKEKKQASSKCDLHQLPPNPPANTAAEKDEVIYIKTVEKSHSNSNLSPNKRRKTDHGQQQQHQQENKSSVANLMIAASDGKLAMEIDQPPAGTKKNEHSSSPSADKVPKKPAGGGTK